MGRESQKRHLGFTKIGYFKEILMLVLVGIGLPTSAVYSDLALILALSHTHPIFATALSIPVIVSLLFLIPHWWTTEKTTQRRIMTLPLLLLQLWPQYIVMKLIITLWKGNQEKYLKKKEQHDRDVACLGM